jgi:hypothetical protein
MKRIPITILITALIVGAILFLGTCNTNVEKVKPDKTQLIKAEKQVSSIDILYREKFVQLKMHSDSVEKNLFLTQNKLQTAKMKLGQSEIELLKLAKEETDSLSVTEQLTNCDSLKAQALSFTNMVDSTQCIYETNISELKNLVATKDSEIVVCRSSYEAIKSVADENLDRERKLTEDLQTAYKVQKRKVIQNKLLAGGILLLSGISTTLYINANK